MAIFMSALLLIAGVGVFLAGMQKMSAGLEQGAGDGVRRLFNKISGNRVAAYGIGVGVTALVQSSSATSIMTIGMANAKIVDTKQGAAIILGAKVGTTLTAFIFALSGLSKGAFSTGILFASTAFPGVILAMLAKSDRQKNIAAFLLGFGMLFLGLEIMSVAISGSESALGTAITVMFSYDAFKNPFLLILIGTIFTCIIQSSTAATAIYITLLTTGVLDSVDQSFFLVLGANIGTCADGLMASVGGNADGKRLALFHVMTSTLGAVAAGVITAVFRTPIVNFFTRTVIRPEWSLAIYNLFYNTVYTLIMLPFLIPLVSFTQKLIKDKKNKNVESAANLNPRLLQNRALAIMQVKREIIKMGGLASENLQTAFDALLDGNARKSAEVFEREKILNLLNQEISGYLIRLSSLTDSMTEETAIGSYHHVINDVERIGDHAENFMLIALELENMGDGFGEGSKSELTNMYGKVKTALSLCFHIFEHADKSRLKEISALEDEIDSLHKSYSKEHFKALNDRSNAAEILFYYDIITELERISDHAVNIAFSIVNPVGAELLVGN